MRVALIVAAALAAVALAGCKREPSFDERYAAAQKQIGDTASQIEAQVDATGAPTPLQSGAQE